MKISTNTAAVLVVLIVALAAVLIAGPPELQAQLSAGLGGLGALLLASMRPLVTRDADRNGVADWVGHVEKLLERIFMGPGGGAGGAALVALAVAFSSGCGGGQLHTYRVGVEQYGEAVAILDEALARRIEAVAPEARAQVRSEIASRQILGVTAEETAELALARYDELMRPYAIATEAARYAAAGGRALDRALDTWGTVEGRSTFMTKLACGLAAFMALADAVIAAGIELPDRATAVAQTLSTWSSESCPEGGAW